MNYGDEGWSCYPDEREYMSGLGSVAGAAGTLAYVPDLAPVGRGADGSYFPRSISDDTLALNFLGIIPDPVVATIRQSTGSQSDDIQTQSGGWDPAFRAAVKAFQSTHGLTADGWIGPNTRSVIAKAVADQNAKVAGGGTTAPPFLPPIVVTPGGSIPAVLPPGGTGMPSVVVTPVSPGGGTAVPGPGAPAKDNTLLIVGGVVVGVGLLATAWYLLK